MSRIDLLAISLSAIIFSTCKTTPVGPDSSPPIIPLTPGNQWVYEMVITDSTGAITNTFSELTTEIYADTLVEGERWYRTSPFCHLYVTNRADGYWARSFFTPSCFFSDVPPYKQIAYPISRNQTVLVGREEQTIIAENVSRTVPAGTFKCVQFAIRDTIENRQGHYRFYSPGIGLIQEQWISTDPAVPGTVVSSLKSFQIAPLY